MKTNKSYTKRLRVTKNGKIVARNPGQNHFNAKERHPAQAKKGRAAHVVMTNQDRARFLPGTK